MIIYIYIFYATLYESLTKVPHGSQPRSRLVILWANLLQIFGCSSFLVWSICWVAIFRNFFGVKIQHLKYMTCWDSTNLLTAGTDVYVTTPSNYRGLQGLTKLQALLKFRGWLWGLDPGIHEVFFYWFWRVTTQVPSDTVNSTQDAWHGVRQKQPGWSHELQWWWMGNYNCTNEDLWNMSSVYQLGLLAEWDESMFLFVPCLNPSDKDDHAIFIDFRHPTVIWWQGIGNLVTSLSTGDKPPASVFFLIFFGCCRE